MPFDDLPDLSSFAVKKPNKASQKVSQYDALFEKHGRANDVDPDLLRSMTITESEGNPNAQSFKRATGLMQLIPATAQRFGVTDITNPDQNIAGGTKYMKFLLDRYKGDVDRALVGYNAGEGKADREDWRDAAKKWSNSPTGKGSTTDDYRRIIRGRYQGGGYYHTALPDLSQFNQADLPDLSQFQAPDLSQFAVQDEQIDDPYAQIGATTERVQPVTEKPDTIVAQIQSANDPKVKTRFGVLSTDPSQASLFANQPNFKPFETKEGTLWLNTGKIFANKKLKLKNEKDLQQYLKNPKALTTLIGIAEDVGNNTRGTAVVARGKDGTELATGVVTNPVSAVEQAQNYKDQFPDAEIEVTDTDVVTDRRKQGEEIDRLAPTSMTGEADDVAPQYPVVQQKPSLPITRPKQAVIAPKAQPKAIQQAKAVTPVSSKMPVGEAMPELTEQDYQEYFTAHPDFIDTVANRNAVQELYKTGKWNTEAQRKRLGESSEPVMLDDEPAMQKVSVKDADNAIADLIDVEGLSIEDATKKVRSEMSAKYGKDFSTLVLTDGKGNPITDPAQLKKQIGLTYGKLKTYGVDTDPLVSQKVAETRIEDPEPDLRVKSDFSAEDAESLNNTFGTTLGSAIASTLNAGGNTANSLAGLLKIIQDLNPAKLDSMAEAARLEPYRAGDNVVKYLQGVGASTGALAAKSGDKYYEPATADDKGYLEGRPVEKDTWLTMGGKAVGALADMPRVALMPGGLAAPMLSFATDAMLQAASQGEKVDWGKVKQAGTHGAVLGGIAQVAPFVGKAGDTVISTLLNKASSNVLKEGIVLGTIGGGTYAASRAMGASPDAAFREAVLFSAMHGFGVLKKMIGEPIRVKDTNGNEAVIKVSENGKVETLDPKTEAKAQMVIPKEVETQIQAYLKKDAEIQAEAKTETPVEPIKPIGDKPIAKGDTVYSKSGVEGTVESVNGKELGVEWKNKPDEIMSTSADNVFATNPKAVGAVKTAPIIDAPKTEASKPVEPPKSVEPQKVDNLPDGTKVTRIKSDGTVEEGVLVTDKFGKRVDVGGKNTLSTNLPWKVSNEENLALAKEQRKVLDEQIDTTVADTTITPEKAAESILKTYESTNTPNTNVKPAKSTEVKTDSNVRGESKSKSKVDAVRPQGTKGTDSVQPSTGTKPSKIGVSIERKAVEKGLVDTFEGTAGYEPTTIKEQASKIAEILTDPAKVKRIISGEEKVPEGLKQSYFIKGVEDNALAKGDVETLKALAKSKLTSDTSLFAQEMRMMKERSQDSVTAQINELRSIRREAQKIKGHDVKGIDKRIADLEAQLVEHTKTVAKMQTKAEIAKVTSEQNNTRPLLDRAEKYAAKLRGDAEKARERLKKRGAVFTSGIDPVALKDLAQIGASHIADLGLDFAKFSDKMIAEFGDKVKPHLKDIYDKAQEVATRFERRALKAIETRLEKQVADLERQIETKTRDVIKRERIELSEKGKELEAKRNELRKELDALVPKERQTRTIGQKQEAYKKNLERQIEALNKRIETGEAPKKGERTPTNPVIEKLKTERDALKAKLPAVDKSISDEQYNTQRAKALQKQIADLNEQIQSGVKKDRVTQARKLSPEVERLATQRDALKAQYDEVFGKPEMSTAKRLQAWKQQAENRIAILKGEKEAPIKGEPITTKLDAEGQKLQMQINLLKSKVDLTDAEIEKIAELTKNVADTRAKLEGNQRTPLGKPTDAEIAYATADVALSKYVDDLKIKAGRTSPREFREANWKGKAKIAARGALKLAMEHPGFTKNILASLDASATALTGWRFAWAHPKLWAKNALKGQADLIKTFGNQPVADALKIDIQGRPNQINGTYKKMGLDVSAREEDFPMENPFGRLAQTIDKIPSKGNLDPRNIGKQALKVVPNAFVASENAFVGFQHRNRADLADLLLPRFEKNPRTDTDYQNLGRFINGLTGRGYLGKNVEKASQVVNLLMFAPRFLKSELDAVGHIITGGATIPELATAMLGKEGGNKGTNFVRVEAAKDLAQFVAGTATVLALANMFNPGSVEFDPRSSDFGKIKIGNTRFDVSGHMASLVTLAARLITSETKSGKTGEISKLNEKDKKGKQKWGGRTTLDVFEDYVEGKASPYGHFFLDWFKGEDFDGNPVDLTSYKSWDRAMTNMHKPLPIKNVEELLNDPNAAPLWAGIIADYFGVTTNTYGGAKHVQRLIDEARKRGDEKEVERLQPILIESQKIEAKKDLTRKEEINANTKRREGIRNFFNTLIGDPPKEPEAPKGGMPMQKK